MSKENRVSDERLAEMVGALHGVTVGPWHSSRQSDDAPVNGPFYEIGSASRGVAGKMHALDANLVAMCDPQTLRSILTELQSLRPKPVAGVEVKPLEWVKIFEWGNDLKADTILGGYTISIDGPGAGGASNLWMAGADTDTFEVFDTLREAKVAAEADYRNRIMSALLPKATALVVNEPVDDADEAYEIGKRDGYEQAVQDIDRLTGGDGEYRYCSDHDPERHTPDADTMKARISDRFSTLSLPAQEPEEDEGSRQAAVDIADAVIKWMVKHDLLDPEHEYFDHDIIEVLNDFAPAEETRILYRHQKRGTVYELIGIGKMQTEMWEEREYTATDEPVAGASVDMREVAVYRSVDNPNEIWVRPRGEFEDGRFEALTAALKES